MAEETLSEISLRIFGTRDYASVLEILPPYDGSVLQFKKEAEKIKPPYERSI